MRIEYGANVKRFVGSCFCSAFTIASTMLYSAYDDNDDGIVYKRIKTAGHPFHFYKLLIYFPIHFTINSCHIKTGVRAISSAIVQAIFAFDRDFFAKSIKGCWNNTLNFM